MLRAVGVLCVVSFLTSCGSETELEKLISIAKEKNIEKFTAAWECHHWHRKSDREAILVSYKRTADGYNFLDFYSKGNGAWRDFGKSDCRGGGLRFGFINFQCKREQKYKQPLGRRLNGTNIYELKFTEGELMWSYIAKLDYKIVDVSTNSYMCAIDQEEQNSLNKKHFE